MRVGAQGPATARRNIFYIAIIIVSATLIYLLVVEDMRFFLVPSDSMAPTLVQQEYLLTLKADTYTRGDIVVLEDPDEEGGYLVKRIVATENDEVAIRGGGLFLNDSYASEPYCMEAIDYEMARYTVKPSEIFVLGDNRNWSVDSHNWNHGIYSEPDVRGVPIDAVVGRVQLVYLPLKRMRRIRPYPLDSIGDITPQPPMATAQAPAGPSSHSTSSR